MIRSRQELKSTASRNALFAVSNTLTDATLGAGSASVRITAITDQRLIAPTGVWFEATGLSGFDASEETPVAGSVRDPSFHDIYYIWTVTQGGRKSTYSTPGLNIPDFWRNRNTAYGKMVAFVFDTPGPVTVECFAVDHTGNSALATWSGMILDPDTVYSGKRTICYSPTGNFTGAPSGATLVTTSWTDVFSLRQAIVGDARILLRGGETYADVQIRTNSGWWNKSNIRIGNYGTGRAILSGSGTSEALFAGKIASAPVTTEFCLYGVEMVGNYNANTQTGSDGRGRKAWEFIYTSGHFVLHDTITTGWNGTTPVGKSWQGAATFILSESQITNCRQYHMFVHNDEQDHDRLAFIGSDISCRLDADVGATSSSGAGNTYGPLRMGYMSRLVMDGCSLFCRSGNSEYAGGEVREQPATRMYTAGMAGPGTPYGYAYANVQRCVAEGGSVPWGWYASISRTSGQLPYNLLLDKVLACGGYQTDAMILAETGPVTIRNAYLIQPDCTNWTAVKQFISYANSNTSSTAPRREDHAIYNQTTLMLKTTARNAGTDTGGISVFGEWSFYTGTVIQENNIFHAPNMATPDTSQGPFSASVIPGWRPRHRGRLSAAAGMNSMDYTYGVPTHTVTVGNASGLRAGTELTFSGGGTFGLIRKEAAGDNTLVLHHVSGIDFIASGETVEATSTTGSSSEIPYFYVPTTGSPAFRTVALGLSAYDDFTGQKRPSSKKTLGAIEP